MEPGKGNVRPVAGPIFATPTPRRRFPAGAAMVVVVAVAVGIMTFADPPPGVTPPVEAEQPILSLIHDWPQHNADPAVIGPG